MDRTCPYCEEWRFRGSKVLLNLGTVSHCWHSREEIELYIDIAGRANKHIQGVAFRFDQARVRDSD